MKFTFWAAISMMFFVVACSSNPPKNENTTKKSNATKPATAGKSANPPAAVDADKLQQQSDLNRIVTKKSQIAGGVSLVANPQNSHATFSTNPKDAGTSAQLYDQMVYQYEIRNWMGFQERLSLMQQKFPKSPEMADSLYLAGLLKMSEKNYGKSLQLLSQIQNHFPQSHQMASVIYTKGVIYRKMELKGLAKNMWDQVIEKFPGSPEAAKASSELRLFR